MLASAKIIGAGVGAGFANRSYSTKRLTNAQRDSFSNSPHLHEVYIGLSLGDLCIRKEYVNAILRFEQGSVHEAYILPPYI